MTERQTSVARPSSFLANALELCLQLSRLEPLQTLYFFASLRLLGILALLPPLTRGTAAFRVLRRPAHTFEGTREGLDVCRVGFFEAKIVRAFEMLCDLVKLVVVFLKEIVISTRVGVSTGMCR